MEFIAEKGTSREKLLGSADGMKPKILTPNEIKAKYRKSEGVSSAAAHARDKLAERQEKLERLSKNSEEMKSESENYATMAKELAKKVETGKWWHL